MENKLKSKEENGKLDENDNIAKREKAENGSQGKEKIIFLNSFQLISCEIILEEKRKHMKNRVDNMYNNYINYKNGNF